MTYWTKFSMIAFGTMSIMVRRTMLKYELIKISGASFSYSLACRLLMTY